MSKRNILFSPPDISELEINEVVEALKSGWITTGPKTKEFERRIADYCNVNKAVCLNSQTACAEMTLRILGIGEGMKLCSRLYLHSFSFCSLSCWRKSCFCRCREKFFRNKL